MRPGRESRPLRSTPIHPMRTTFLLNIALLSSMLPAIAADPAPANTLTSAEKAAGWRLLWSSEDPAYGAAGTPPAEGEFGWHLPGHAALVMTAEVPHGDGD